MISIYPNGKLLDKAEAVTFPLSEEVAAIIEQMKEEMAEVGGVGLGATQIGHLLRIFVIDKQVAGTADHVVFINPQITEKSEETSVAEEGCLSFPGIGVKVKRHVGIKCSAYDAEGNVFLVEAKDFYARAIQHEEDHLNGKLIVHYLGVAQRSMAMNKMKQFLRNAKRQAREIMKHSHTHR